MKCILSDCQNVLSHFFKCCSSFLLMPLMPVLTYLLPTYQNDDVLCKALTERYAG